MNKEKFQIYFKTATQFDMVIWAVAGLLLIKWMLGPVTINMSFYRETFGVTFWGFLLYVGAFLAIRLGLLTAYISEKKALLIMFGLCSFFIVFLALVLELRRPAPLQFLLSMAVIGLQTYAYRSEY